MQYRLIQIVLLVIVFSGQAFGAQNCEITSSLESINAALREDSLRWHAASAKGPLAECCFDDIKMVQWGINSEAAMDDMYALNAKGKYAYAYNKASGHAYDLSIGMGYHFYRCDCCLKVTPCIGFSIERQWFKKNCCFEDVNISYRTHWYSPWIGLSGEYLLSDFWKVYGSASYHYCHLRAQGQARFDNAEENFKHRGWGNGFDFTCCLQYILSDEWCFNLCTDFEMRNVKSGKQQSVQRQVIANQEDGEWIEKNHLQHVEWRSFRFEFAIGYRF